MGGMRFAVSLALALVTGCRPPAAPAGVAPQPQPGPRADEPTKTRTPAAVQPVAIASPVVSARCTTSLPLQVSVENRTRVRGDLCAAFERVAGSVPGAVAWSSPPIELHVALAKLEGRNPTQCELTIAAKQGSIDIANAAGGAKVTTEAGNDRFGARDCVDAVIEDLLMRKIWPAVQRHALGAPTSTPTTAPRSRPSAPTSNPVP